MHPHPARLLSEVRLLADRPRAGAADAVLLDRYVLQGDQDAFACLVARHGPMVLGVCRRLLPDPHLAEDACQAAFLVLARKAAAVRPGASLPAWLHGVAHRVALKARSARARDRLRQARPLAAEPADPGADPLTEVSARELLAAVDEEVGRLPEVYRLPVLLCCLEGGTQEEAARLLGWTAGSVQGRLERGRARLRQRLARRGLALPSVLAAVEVSRAAAFPARLLGAVAGSGPAVSVRAAALAEETLRGMAAGIWKAVAALVLVAGALAAGAGALAPRPPAAPAPGRGALAGPAAERPRVDRQGDPLPPGAVARLGTVRLRHGGRVAGLAFSPDGKTLATSSDGLHDPVICLWDVATGKELRRIHSPNPLSHFTSLAFSPDGRTLASGESGPFHRRAGEEVKVFVRLWDVGTGKERRARAWHAENISCVAFSPDGKTLASCAYDRTVRLWEAATGRELHSCTGHPFAIYSVAFSPDGKTLASGGYDGLRLWDVTTGKQKRVIRRAGNPGLTTVAFSPDGRSLATGWGHTVRLLDPATGKTVREFRGHTKEVWAAVAFLPGGKSLVSAGRDGTVRVWEVATGKELRRTHADHDDLHHLALSPDGKMVAAGGQGGAAHLWDTATGKALHHFAGHTGSVMSLRYSPDGKTLASGAGDGTVRLWDVRTGKTRKLREKGEWVCSVAFSPDGKTLLADDPFSLWDVASGRVVRRFAGHEGGTSALAFAPDGKTVASGGMDRLIRLWDAATGKELRRLAGHKAGVGELAFSPDGKRLASLGNYQDRERLVYLWDLARGKVVHRFGPARGSFGQGSLAFSPDGRSVMAVSDGETVRFWEAATGKESRALKVPGRQGDLEGVSALSSPTFSPDGKYLALGWHQSVRVFELATGGEVRSFAGSYGPVAWAPDGRTLASAEGTSILTWDVTGRAPDRRLREQRLEPGALGSKWDDLSSEDAARAHRGVWALVASAGQSVPFLQVQPQRKHTLVQLVASAGQSVPFLRERLLRRPPAGDEQIRQWVADLDSDQFATRQKATDELKKLGRFAEPALRRALRGDPSLEQRRRVEQLLKQLAAPAQRLLAARVTQVLEQIGTPEARRVLEALAGESARVPLTREAQSALRRLEGRGSKP